MYKAPNYIQRELKVINPLYFAVWDNARKYWRIVKKKSWYSKERNWRFDSVPILKILDNKDLHAEAKYKALDMRTIHMMKEGFYNARKAMEISRAIDNYNEALDEKANEDARYIGRETANDIWRHFREKTIDMGGRGKR